MNISKVFIKSVGQVFSANLIAQVLNILSVLLLSKFLTEESFGIYSVFLAYSAIFISINLLSYEKTIPNVMDDELSDFLVGVLMVAGLFLVFVSLILFFTGYTYTDYVLIHIAIMSFSKMFQMLAIRAGDFRALSYLRVFPAVFFLVLIVFYYYSGHLTHESAIILYCISNFITVLITLHYFKAYFAFNSNGCISRAKILLKKERGFALFTAPSEILNRLSYYLPTLIIDQYFGASLAGHYSLTLRICFSPITLMTSAIGQVFQSTLAMSERNSQDRAGVLNKKTLSMMAVAAISISLGFYFIVPELTILIFGETWIHTYQFIKVLAPMFGVMCVITPLTSALYVYRRNVDVLFQQAIFFAISLVSFFAAVYLGDLLVGIYLFSFLSIVRYAYVLFVLKRFI